MKKVIVLFVLFIFGMNMFAQEIMYKPVFYHKCDNEYMSWYWTLSDSDSIYNKGYGKVDSIVLPKMGTYYLRVNFDIEENEIIIDSYGTTIDTFNIKMYYYSIIQDRKPMLSFCKCRCDNDTVDGLVTEYYLNGNLRLTGSFINNELIDTASFYYRTGEISKEIFIEKKVVVSIRYNKNGEITSKYLVSKKWRKSFNSDGDLSHYENKNLLLDYYEDEILQYKIKREYDPKIWGLKNYISTTERYDSTGIILVKIVHNGNYKFTSTSNSDLDQTYISDRIIANEFNYLINVTLYKNGIAYKKIEETSYIYDYNSYMGSTSRYTIYDKNDEKWEAQGGEYTEIEIQEMIANHLNIEYDDGSYKMLRELKVKRNK